MSRALRSPQKLSSPSPASCPRTPPPPFGERSSSVSWVRRYLLQPLRSAKLTATDQKCCILPKFEEQSLTCGSQSSSVEDQPQCRGMWHSSSPSARSLSRSPSPSFTQSPSLPRSLVCDGQTSPHRPLLVVSRSTCPPLSPSPLSNSFVIGTAVINTHTTTASLRVSHEGGQCEFKAISTIRALH